MKINDNILKNTVFLSLGSNLNNRFNNINLAKNIIKKECGEILKISKIYETESWGKISNNKYLNQLIKIQTNLKPNKLLTKLLLIEKKLGRKRTINKFADRIIDIDILFYNNQIISNKNLLVPHPRLHLRKFILIPFNEIEKKFIHPKQKKTIATLLKNCKDNLNVKIYNPKQIKYICIEGNIGSGKTTLSKALGKEMNAKIILENFEKNSLLPLFYSNPKSHAFSLEYSFLISRFEILKKQFVNKNDLVVSDFSFFKSLWFAKINLSKKEFMLFKNKFFSLAKELPKPDLIIYLNTSIQNLNKNIKFRGRLFEKNISNTYLNSIFKKYDKGLKSLKMIPQFKINIKNFHPNLETESIKSIKKFISESFQINS